MKSKVKIYKLVLLLILLDQGIKLIIKNFLYNDKFSIIGDILIFNPILNNKYSWYNSKFNIGMGKFGHIIWCTITIIIFMAIYMYIKEKHPNNKAFIGTSTFLFAGSFCSLIDKVFWGGSLDFIQLSTFFTFDLKDVYITLVEFGLIYLCITNYKYLKDVGTKDVVNDIKKVFRIKIEHMKNRKDC